MSVTQDKLGIFLSVLCCIHCLALPFLVALSPAIGGWMENEWVHVVLLLLVAPIAYKAFSHGRKHHKNYLPFWLGMGGVSLLILGLLFDIVFGLGENWERSFTVLGGVALVIAHILNLRHCRCH